MTRGPPRLPRPAPPCPYTTLFRSDAAIAQSYLDAGGYYWNSGMFLFRASRYLEELARYRADILDGARAAFDAARRDGDFIRLDKDAFAATPAESIRSEEHTSELQSLMRISYAVFCLTKKKYD